MFGGGYWEVGGFRGWERSTLGISLGLSHGRTPSLVDQTANEWPIVNSFTTSSLSVILLVQGMSTTGSACLKCFDKTLTPPNVQETESSIG